MQYSGFIEHLEAIISINILLLVCLKLSVLFCCAVSGVCQLFHVKRRSAVTYPMIWVISAYSLLFQNVIMSQPNCFASAISWPVNKMNCEPTVKPKVNVNICHPFNRAVSIFSPTSHEWRVCTSGRCHLGIHNKRDRCIGIAALIQDAKHIPAILFAQSDHRFRFLSEYTVKRLFNFMKIRNGHVLLLLIVQYPQLGKYFNGKLI